MFEAEEEAVEIAVEALYFDDSSDYKKALYMILGVLKGNDFRVRCYDDIKSVYEEINGCY